METAVVLDMSQRPIYWHLPPGRSAVSLPDSRKLWDLLWSQRDSLLGVAHSHPGNLLRPSLVDVSTFAAVEAGLGRRLFWWIVTQESLAVYRYHPRTGGYEIVRTPLTEPMNEETPSWVASLRHLSSETKG